MCSCGDWLEQGGSGRYEMKGRNKAPQTETSILPLPSTPPLHLRKFWKVICAKKNFHKGNTRESSLSHMWIWEGEGKITVLTKPPDISNATLQKTFRLCERDKLICFLVVLYYLLLAFPVIRFDFSTSMKNTAKENTSYRDSLWKPLINICWLLSSIHCW